MGDETGLMCRGMRSRLERIKPPELGGWGRSVVGER